MNYESDVDAVIPTETEQEREERLEAEAMPVWEIYAEETRQADVTVYIEAPTKEDAERYARDMMADGSFFAPEYFNIVDNNLDVIRETHEQLEYAWEDYLG